MRLCRLTFMACMLFWNAEERRCNGFTSTASSSRTSMSPWSLGHRQDKMVGDSQSKFGCGRCRSVRSSTEDDVVDSIMNGSFFMDDDMEENDEEKELVMDEKDIFEFFEGTEEEGGTLQVVEFELNQHKPLGCTVEESVAFENVKTKKGSFHHVFVAKVAEGGNAEKAGLQPGDVIVGLSGSFDEITDVIGVGLDRVRLFVSGREEDKALKIRVVRNSNVISTHESMLIDLCTLDGDSQKELNNCLNTIMSNEMVEDSTGLDEANCGGDDEAECLLETMFESWVDEMPGVPKEDKEEEKVEETKKVAPWSSRSSPSGTYVRDPATGKMRNIDA